MSYILGQYNKNSETGDDDSFMTLITQGSVKRIQSSPDDGIIGSTYIFSNECIVAEDYFLYTKNYYFHGKIKRMTSDQTFYIRLIDYYREPDEDNIDQYIKTVTVAKGDPDQWVDIEFLFTPYTSNFNTVMFELQRTAEDYKEEIRYPLIVYEELSIINNIIPIKIGNNVELLKIGVQSRPGLMMCLNGEDIRLSRTGVFEFRNNLIHITFFSVVNAAKETEASLDIINATINEINTRYEEADELPTAAEREAAKAAIGCRQFLDLEKIRKIDNFTLDYMYRES